ncbi:MAG: hypothetical protein Kow0031_23650 [Anaerolineae bacterium]
MPNPAKKPYAVRALIVNNGEILFIHHRFKNPAMFNKWTFPGGRLNQNETDPLQALHREMKEELSVEVEVFGKIGVFYSRARLDYTIYGATVLGSIGPLNEEEIRDTTWLTPAEVYNWHTRGRMQFGFEMKAVSAYLKKFT